MYTHLYMYVDHRMSLYVIWPKLSIVMGCMLVSLAKLVRVRGLLYAKKRPIQRIHRTVLYRTALLCRTTQLDWTFF